MNPITVPEGDDHRIGYARISTVDQNVAGQIEALRAACCGRIYTDVASGAKAVRPGLDALHGHLRRGDTVVVVKLDRLGRSTVDLLRALERWAAKGIGFVAVEQGIDTTTAVGRMVTTFLAAVAEFERELIRERTHGGLAAARARGRRGGRPTVMTPAKLTKARRMLATGEVTLIEAAEAIGVGRATLIRHLKAS